MTARPHVLVVEDNPVTAKLVRFTLGKAGFDVSEVTGGVDALRCVDTRTPDLILQDLMLPDMDGFELAGRFRRLEKLAKVPILAFSGLLSKNDERRVAAAGFTDMVPKPVEPSRLLRIIKAHLPNEADAGEAFGRGLTLLLADDDEVQRRLTSYRLRKLGFDVIEAGDGEEALDAALRQRPDLLVTDAMMPRLDGFGLCAAIRRVPALQDLPIVLATNTYLEEQDRDLGLAAGADAFVIRTPQLQEVITAAREVMSASATSRPRTPRSFVPTPGFEQQRIGRLAAQLERQVGLASTARREVSLLSTELGVLNAVSDVITSHAEFEHVAAGILAACCDGADVWAGALCLVKRDGSIRNIVHAPKLARPNQDLALGAHERLIRSLIDAAELVVFGPDTGELGDRDASSWLEEAGGRHAVSVPIRHRGQAFGVLIMISEAESLAEAGHLVFAETVGNQIGLALAMAKAFEDREASERRAQGHARLLELIFESIPGPVIVAEDGRIASWNTEADALFGLSKSTDAARLLDGEWTAELGVYHADKSRPILPRDLPLARALRGEVVGPVELFLQNAFQPAGAWLVTRAVPLRDDEGRVRGAVSIAREVTEERRAKEQLVMSDRLASIGMLAASVAHEINNPLASVVSNLELALGEVEAMVKDNPGPALGELASELREAKHGANRVREIVRDLKTFSRDGGEVLGPVDVNRVLESALRMATNELRHRARVVTDFGDVPPVVGVESRLAQVFLNLLVNAAQAIPEGHAQNHEVRITTRSAPDDRVVVDVADTGAGIPAEIMGRLFSPFVTSKPVGIGTGLGLSICRKLVTEMKGTITVDSTPGSGTVFHVTLQRAETPVAPVLPDEAGPAAPALPASSAVPRHRILVVDDEVSMGAVLHRTLKAHDVTTMTTAEAALAAIDEGERYDLIFCDLMMPVMTGMEFYEALLTRAPEQAHAVVFMTGGAFSEATGTFLNSIPNRQVEKPFDVDEIKAIANAGGTGRAV